MKTTIEEVQNKKSDIFDLFGNPVDKSNKCIWDISVKVEENGYYWNKEPIFQKGGAIPDDKPIVVELFSGCGGTSLGFEMASFEIVLGCDIHTPSIQTFKTNHPNSSTITGDIKKVNPLVIKELIKRKLIDYIAMDIKAPLERYEALTKVKVDLRRIEESINIIENSFLEYEFRTTYIPSFLTFKDLSKILSLIKNKNRFKLQKFIFREEKQFLLSQSYI